MKKRLVTAVLMLCLALSLVACGGGSNNDKDKNNTENTQQDDAQANKDTEVCTFEDEKHFESELADIICCVLIIAGKEDIDIERAIYDCIEKNERRANGIGDKL